MFSVNLRVNTDQMKSNERAAITRVLTDMIKADQVIDQREMQLYARQKELYGLTRRDEIEASDMTLQQAVSTIREMQPADQQRLIDEFDAMSLSDNFCAREEALLMTALQFCLNRPELECDVLSYAVEESWFDPRQVIYVESHHDRRINSAIRHNLRSIGRELLICGFDFVYLPHIINHYVTAPRDLLNDMVSMLAPALSQQAVESLLTKLKLYKTDTFCIEQLHHKLGFTELADTWPALLLRVGRSKTDGRMYTHFLRIGLDGDVLETVRDLADTFMGYNGSDNLNVSHRRDEHGKFLYTGFYRQLFDIVTLQKAVVCHLHVDLVHGTLGFPEIDITLNDLHRKEKALYVLFVYEIAASGISDEDGKIKLNGGISFTAPTGARELAKFNARMQRLQRRYAMIYEAFGGNPDTAPDITRAEIRLPMISGIRRAINKRADKIYDADRFIISRDQQGTYAISTAQTDLFVCTEFSNPRPINIFASNLFGQIYAKEG